MGFNYFNIDWITGYLNIVVGICVSKQESCINHQYTEEKAEPVA